MHKIIFCLLFCLFSLSCRTEPKKEMVTEETKTNSPPTLKFITEPRQFTFEGSRAGEGYFSQDGKWLVFQSEREPNNPFYQIYLMNLQTRQTRRISPGMGKTTCAWIHPSNQKVLFASTHLDPQLKQKVNDELKQRANPIKAKYSWSFDDQFDLFEASSQGKNLKRLTQAKGYDAEGSYSPDGQWIAFASNRSGYTDDLSPEEKTLFEKDPSSQMEIYLMKADGSQVKRLTNHLGYDGGPFFSPDGQKIIWRRFNKQGNTAEIFTMNRDGSGLTQLTKLNAMSWAPFFHPSGQYVIFTTNKLGYSNFELYIVDSEGKHDPVRASDLPGFDGLPVFSPDGQSLLWTHTNDKGDAQLFQGRWNHSLALSALQLAPNPDTSLLSPNIQAQDVELWVRYLASAKMKGRASGSTEEIEYTKTLANAFHGFGLKPWQKDYVQTFEFTSDVELGPQSRAALGTTTLQVGQQWLPLSLSKIGKTESPKELVFVGYGIVAPAVGDQAAYDSYGEAKVEGKWVVVFDGIPEDLTNARRHHLNLYGRLQHKALIARQKGAAGLILVNDSNSSAPTLKLKFEGRADNAGLLMIRFSDSTADKLFTGKDSRAHWTKKLARGEVAQTDLGKLTLDAQVDLQFKKSQGHNVIAQIKVPNATSTLVIGAHGDHLGLGEHGNSLARGEEQNQIHLGADDNASGVSAVMELAQFFQSEIKSGRFKPKQNLVLAVWSGEEIGLLGSTYFLKTIPKGTKISAYLNMDMVGRLRDNLIVQGVGSAKEWRRLLEGVGAKTSVPLNLHEDPYLPTDSMAFYVQGIPAISLFTGSHGEYHTPRDHADTLNYNGVVQVAQVMGQLIRGLSQTANSPVHYQKVQGKGELTPGGTRSFRLYLGTIPDYTAEGKQGVLISGTSKDSPAEKAGLKAGDVIIELGGVKIQNIYDYVYCLQAMKAGQQTPMKVMRANRLVEMQITPVLKQ